MLKPDLRYSDRTFTGYLPSWGAHSAEFINEAHASIYEKTKHMEGWQARGDSLKLFEMGYYCGEVILEIGVYRGRSAVVSLLGALSNSNRKHDPQYYGVDIAPMAIAGSANHLNLLELEKYTLLVRGTIETFASQMDLAPTMVFLDGDHSYDGCKFDLEILSDLLVEDTPVLCHDYIGPADKNPDDFTAPARDNVVPENMWIGVQKACYEWERAGYAEFIGTFGCSALFVTTAKCQGNRGGIRKSRLEKYRKLFKEFYLKEGLFFPPSS